MNIDDKTAKQHAEFDGKQISEVILRDDKRFVVKPERQTFPIKTYPRVDTLSDRNNEGNLSSVRMVAGQIRVNSISDDDEGKPQKIGEVSVMQANQEKDGEEPTEDQVVDPVDKFLQNNPGNFNRQKAVAVDLSNLEYIRKQLVDQHEEQLSLI